jgi:hypothetical protein
MQTGIPDMMTRITHEQNRRSAGFSLFLGLFAPLTALLMMHFGGQGEWTNWDISGWMGRFVALCCVVVSAPKVYRFFLKATSEVTKVDGKLVVHEHRVEALAATLALEVAALMAVSHVIGLYAFGLQVVINVLVYSNNITQDQHHIKAVEREERASADTLHIPTIPMAVDPKPRPKREARKPKAQPRKTRKVITLKTGRKAKRTA